MRFVVPAGNTVEFAAALDRARESVQRFTPDVVIDQWERPFDLLHR